MEINAELFNGLTVKGMNAPDPSQIRNFLERENEKMLTHEQVIDRISKYFSECLELVVNSETGEETQIWRRVPTKSGLSNALDINVRSLENYLNPNYANNLKGAKQGKIAPEDIPIIKKALQVIADYYEARLLTAPAGAIFWLKNLNCGEWLDDKRLQVVSEQSAADLSAKVRRTPEEIMQRFSSSELPEKPIIEL